MRVHELRTGRAMRFASPSTLRDDPVTPLFLLRRGELVLYSEYLEQARMVIAQYGRQIPVPA